MHDKNVISYYYHFNIGLVPRKVINPKTKHSTLRSSFGTLFKFQRLVHHSFDRYCISTKLILAKEQGAFIQEIGHVHNCMLSQKGCMSSDFKTINVMYSVWHSIKPLLQHFKNKQKAYKKTAHRFSIQDARIIIPEFKGRDSGLNLKTNNGKKRRIFSIITGLEKFMLMTELALI